MLLDTAVLLYVTYDAPRLSPVARYTYNDKDAQLFVSVVSIWEIVTKNRLGKLPLPVSIEAMLRPLKHARSLHILPLTESAVLRLTTLPDVHRDPFDRMLVCQAIDEGLTFLTPDRQISAYPVPTLW